MKDFKKEFSFIDKDGRKAKIVAELTHRNGYPEFTACGDYMGGGGQCLNRINPRTHDQGIFINLWKEYHLKDISKLPENVSFHPNFLGHLENIIDEIEKEQRQHDKNKEVKTGDELLLEQMHEYGIDKNELDACKAYLSNFCDDTTLEGFEEAYCGHWHSDEDFTQEQAESCGIINEGATWPNNCIDWEQASRELMLDYFEVDGYYFRHY